MPQWLLFVISLLALAAGVFALLRANRVDAAVLRFEAAVGRPHAHAGIGLRPFGRFLEFRAGLDLRVAALLDERRQPLTPIMVDVLRARVMEFNRTPQIRRQ